jgi:hypothetical protein
MDILFPLMRGFIRYQAVCVLFVHQRPHSSGKRLQMVLISPFLSLIKRYATPKHLAIADPAGFELIEDLDRLWNSKVMAKDLDKRGLGCFLVIEPLRDLLYVHYTS